jgi:hypothetical protein
MIKNTKMKTVLKKVYKSQKSFVFLIDTLSCNCDRQIGLEICGNSIG